MHKERINKYDNLKGLAIILVVLGHFDFMNTFGSIDRLFFLIDLPLFFFVSGYFSKIDINQPSKAFKRLMLPYFIFCFLIELFRWFYLGSANWNKLFICTSMAMWFLIALFIMKMSLPILDKFRYPILTTFIFVLIFGLFKIDSNILGLTRTFAYLPIFMLGFYYNSYKEYFSKTYKKAYDFYDRHFKLLVIPVILATVVVYMKFQARFYHFKVPYSGNLLFEVIKRAIMLLLIMAWVIIFNRIMTNREIFLTKIGRNSMAVYILHLFLICFLDPIWSNIFTKGPESLIATLVLTAATVIILSRDVVTKYFNKFTDGVYNLIAMS